jgi:FkbM family methyltransferase
MTSRLKSTIRDALPGALQVPLKFYVDRWRGYHEPEMTLLPYLVTPGDRAIDVGGNRGAYAYQLYRQGTKVEVFEPNPACFKVLQAWARHRDSVTIHPVGLSDHQGSVELQIPIDDSGVEHDASASMEPHLFARARAQVVSLRTLDSYGLEGARFLKIDVEGHESNVLKGAAALLAASRPAVLVEIERRHLARPMVEVFDLIVQSGYVGWFLDRGVLRTIAQFDPAVDQSMTAFEGGGGGYINNFLFLAQEHVADGRYERLFATFEAA